MAFKTGKLSEGNPDVLAQGAEAKIFLDKNKGKIIKERIKKGYRINEIDSKIRKQRTRAEKKLLLKASQIINCPKPLENQDEYKIEIPYIKGKKLSESLDSFSLEKQKKICNEIGKMIAKLHENNIIHGDLTTSNMIFLEKENKVFFIDFGLGFFSDKIEDKAVDLHLLRQALETRHFKNAEELFEQIIKGYEIYSKSKQVMERFERVDKRGRYKGSY